MNTEVVKDTFIVRTEWLQAIKELAPADQLIIYNNLFAFHLGMQVNLPNLHVKLVWKLIEPTLKNNIVKYDKRKETSAANGVLGGRPKNPVHVEIPKAEEQQQAASIVEKPNNLNKPTGLDEKKPNNLLEKPNILNNPVLYCNDSVNVNGNESIPGETPVEKEKILYWHKLVAAWKDFYGQRFKDEQGSPRKPLFKGKHAKQLQQIIQELKKITKDAGREWTEEYAEYTLRGFFQKAWLHDAWLKRNFELGNMISKFDSIVSSNDNSKSNSKPANGTNHGKSAGAISLAHTLAEDLGITDQ